MFGSADRTAKSVGAMRLMELWMGSSQLRLKVHAEYQLLYFGLFILMKLNDTVTARPLATVAIYESS